MTSEVNFRSFIDVSSNINLPGFQFIKNRCISKSRDPTVPPFWNQRDRTLKSSTSKVNFSANRGHLQNTNVVAFWMAKIR